MCFIGQSGQASPTPSASTEFDLVPPHRDTETGWDSLHLFSQDIIVLHRPGRLLEARRRHSAWHQRFERGNLHEVIVVRTEESLDTYPEDIANRLDGAVGGKIPLRSISGPRAPSKNGSSTRDFPGPGSQGRKCSIEGHPRNGPGRRLVYPHG